MRDIFTADFYIGNREKLQQETNSELIVLTANGLLQRSADTTFAFRQDSNFWYLTGIEEADFVLVMNGSSTFLIAPKRGEHRDQWDGSINKKELKQISGIDEIEEHHAGWVRLDKLIKQHKKVHTITPAESYYEHFGFYTNPARAALLTALAKHRRLEQVDIRKTIASMRQIKQQPELAALMSAIGITSKAVESVKKKLGTYKSELLIEADITRNFSRFGANGHAYQPIVAAGQNTSTIHYIDNNQTINSGDLVLMDVGAEVCNYSADISRTYAVSRPSRRQQAVYDAVLEVHAKAIEILGPGVDMKTYEQQIDQFMAKKLKRLGLITDVTDKKQLKKYYPHLTSHFLGLDTHDSADYKLPLAAGMVLTVEPGIYIPDENIGIRIEDDVLVTDSGVEVLSASLSRQLY